VRDSGGYWASMRIESNLMLQIKEAQKHDDELWAIVQNFEDGKHTEFSVYDDGVVWLEDRLCVPSDQALYEKVMTEAHSSPFTVHPGSTKIYRDLKQYFWWNGMKQDVATFVSKCMMCQQVKIEHQRAAPFELLYGRKCRVPICWIEVGECLIEGPELIEITNGKVAVAKEKLNIELLSSC
nr:putative reverse transcriptase domain-containing protein [Tanacetum cinerariifolium]